MSVDSAHVGSAIAYHRAHPEVSIEMHVESARGSLGLSLAARRAIYLDTRYWIFLRDAAAGAAAKPIHVRLLQGIREGVVQGHWFCPLSDTTFFELIHIGDRGRRIATAEVAQELSLGVTLCPEHERVALELKNVMSAETWERAKVRSHVWLKLPYVLGAFVMKDGRFSPDDQTAIAKAFFDHQWDVTLPEVLSRLGDSGLDFPYETIANKVDALNRQHADSVGSFNATYLDEICGVLDLFKEYAADVITQMYRATGASRGPTPDEHARAEGEVYGLLRAIAKAGKGAAAFPTLHVLAKLHAAMRRDKQRPFDRNTLPDFHHAAAALVYGDAFFTEGPLRNLIQSGPVKLDDELDCAVLANEEDALQWLQVKTLLT